jgi:hypothetical protein
MMEASFQFVVDGDCIWGVWLALLCWTAPWTSRSGSSTIALEYEADRQREAQFAAGGFIECPDPWEYGLTERNRKTLEMLAGFSHAQGLTPRRMSLDELFLPVFQGRKRGDEHRI